VIRMCGLVVGLLMGLSTGCSAGESDGPDPDRDAIRAGLAALVTDDRTDPRDVEDGTCFANALMGQTTPEQLRDAGVLDASYAVKDKLPRVSEDLAETWVLAQFRCVDFVEKSAQAQVAITHGKVDAAAYAACLRAALTDDQLRAAVVDTLTGDWDGADLTRFSAAQRDCGHTSQR
jgi:hypothetical protein